MPTPLLRPKQPAIRTQCLAFPDSLASLHGFKGKEPSAEQTMIKNAYRYARNFLTTFPLTRSLLRTLGHAGVLPPSLLKRLYLFNTCRFMVEAEKQDLRFEYEFVQGDQIGQLLYWRGAGGFEPETIRPFIQLVRQVGHFVDIGANTGHFTLVACAANSRLKAYAFEPVPHIFERLKRNVELNSWANRCVLEQKAVCDLEGDKVQFHVPESDIPTSGSLNPDGFNAIPGKCIELGTTRLDKYFQTGPVPDLIKIDVENYEH